MTPEGRKERALEFLRLMDCKDPDATRALVTDDFEYELVWSRPGATPIRGRENFVDVAGAFFAQMFPGGLRFRFLSAVAEGDQVAVQAESEAVAFNGKPYRNRYHYYFRFCGDKIALGREYCDSNYAARVLLS